MVKHTREETKMDKLDNLVKAWQHAAMGNSELSELLFNELLAAYKEHFGELYYDVIHVMLKHMGADFYDMLLKRQLDEGDV